MKKNGCKMMVAALAMTMMLTGCNEGKTTEYGSGNVEVENEVDQSMDTENVDTENLDMEEMGTENMDTESMDAENGDTQNINAENANAENMEMENTDTENIDAENKNTESVETETEDTDEADADTKKHEDSDSAKKETADNIPSNESSNEPTKEEEKHTNTTETTTPNTTTSNNAVSDVEIPSVENTATDTTSQLVKNVINQIITSGMSELEKAKAIHDWMVMNIDYDYQNYLNNTIPVTSWNVDGVLTTKYAICDGYAKTFKALCQATDLECEYVSGSTPNGGHAWNQVKIDGTWYNVDVTWDDPVDRAFDDHSANRYDYFLISDAEMYKDHRANNAQHTCNSSLTDEVMQMYCPWRDYNYSKNADELTAIVREYIDTNTAEMRFRSDSNMYNLNEISDIVYQSIGEYNVVNDYEKVNVTYTTDAWGIRTYIFQFELKNGVFTKFTPVTTEEELKAEILRIKGLPDYTSQKYDIYMTETLMNEMHHFESIGKWLYFDAELVLNCPTYSKHCEGMYVAHITLRPTSAEDIYIESAYNEAEAEAIIQDRLARGVTTFTIRYYYDKNLPNGESYVIYELGDILGEKYGLSSSASPQTTDSCFLYFQPLE